MSKKRANQKSKVDLVPRELLWHIKTLGLNSIGDYREWCKQNGFSATAKKDCKARRRELDFHNDKQALEALKQHRRVRKGACAIERIYKGGKDQALLKDPVLLEISRVFSKARDKRILFDTLVCLQRVSKLTTDVKCIKGIAAAVKLFTVWKRPVKEWTANTHNIDRQFSSLMRHLFADYDVPQFMNSVWMEDNQTCQKWYVHIGSGKNIRTAKKLPVTLTKKMAHHFLFAPDSYSVYAAFRWAQIMALGGNKRIADAINETRLVRNFRDEDFWLSVFRFFISNPMLDPAQINPLVDYIWNQKYEDRIVFVERGVAENRGPAQPNFSMRGRTPDSLLRQVNAWHRSLGHETRGGKLQWQKSGIDDFEYIEGVKDKKNIKIWRIQELLSSQELISEGRAMGHCVASYAMSCKRGRSGIWAMSCQTADGTRKHLTIEVILSSRQVFQVRGKHNRLSTDQEKKIVQRWAQQAGLRHQAV